MGAAEQTGSQQGQGRAYESAMQRHGNLVDFDLHLDSFDRILQAKAGARFGQAPWLEVARQLPDGALGFPHTVPFRPKSSLTCEQMKSIAQSKVANYGAGAAKHCMTTNPTTGIPSSGGPTRT